MRRHHPPESTAGAVLHTAYPLQGSGKSGAERICVKSKGRIIFLDPNEIRWIEAARNYLVLHTEIEHHMVRETLAEFGGRLDPNRFVRIHRSVIVNTQYIREVRPWYTGEYVVILTNGKELTISRGFRSSLDQITAKGGCAKQPKSSSEIVDLAMKPQCEKCGASLPGDATAFICSHECTFCQACSEAMNHVCPNCEGELVRRPRLR